MDLREELARAGKTHDGHVTHGSLSEQMKVIQDWFAHPENYSGATSDCPIAFRETNGHFRCTRVAGHTGPCAAEEIAKTVMTFIREEN